MIQIKHRFTRAVLFEANVGSMKLCVEAAVASGASLDDASLNGARLVGASLDDASLNGASLDDASLNGASLNGARLVGASLDGASLDGASLNGASLNGASLDGASLDDASLNGARLNGARLNGASLDGARLNGASLDGASLDGARLNGASLDGASVIDAGADIRGYRFVAVRHDDGPRIAAGCRWFTLDEAKAHWAVAHADKPAFHAECNAKVALIEAVAKARGWAADTGRTP